MEPEQKSVDSLDRSLKSSGSYHHADASQKAHESDGADSLATKAPQVTLDKLKDLIEILGKVAIGLIALGYAVGLVVINIHLNKYGIHSMSLFRLNYISAGMWALMPMLLPLFVFLLLLIIRKAHSGGKARYSIRGFVIPVILVLSVISFPLVVQHRLQMSFIQVGWLTSLGMGVLFSGYLILTVRDYLIVPARGSEYFALPFTTAAVAVCVLSLHAILFAYNVYDKIPSHLGGGRFQIVQLVLDADNNTSTLFEREGIEFLSEYSAREPRADAASGSARPASAKAPSDKDYKMTNNVELIAVTDEEYILHGRHGALTIQRSVVKAVLYKNGQQ